MNYGGSYNGEARITFSSILLLVIFVSAASLILAAIIWRPWFSDEATIVQAQPTATAGADTVVQQAATGTPGPSVPNGP